MPLPPEFLRELNRAFQLRIAQRDPQLATLRIWRFSRTTAWRYVKAVMTAAGITRTAAMPKGLRHGFDVNAFQSNIPPHLVQRWHASLRTTAIYLYRACRVAVAHANKPFSSDPDDLGELRRLHVAAHVLRALARRFIRSELGVSDCPYDGS